MKRITLSALMLVLVHAGVQAQFSYWYATNAMDLPYSLDIDGHDGYIIGGALVHPGAIVYPFLTRVDDNGNLLWSKKYTLGGDDEYFHSVTSAPWVSPDQFAAVGKTNYGANVDDYLVITHTNGTVAHAKRYGTTRADYAYHITTYDLPVLGRGYIIAGRTDSAFPTGPQENDIHVVRTDTDGNLLASAVFLKDLDQKAYNITATRDQGFVVVGETKLLDCETDAVKILVVKLNSSLDVVWARAIDLIPAEGFSHDRAYAVREDANKDIHIAGTSIVFINNMSDHTEGFQLHLKANGTLVWVKSYPSYVNSMVNNVKVGSGSPGYVLGGSKGPALLFQTDSSGNVIWAKTYPSNNDQGLTGFQHLTKNKQNGYAFTGTSSPTTGNGNMHLVETDAGGSTGGACENNVTLTDYIPQVCIKRMGFPMKMTMQESNVPPTVTSIDPIRYSCKEETASLMNTISPNPAQNTISIHGFSKGDIVIYDLQGMIRKKATFSEDDQIDIADLPEGLYVLKVIDAKKVVKEFRFVKK